jgi:outer membrane immunogenic protein
MNGSLLASTALCAIFAPSAFAADLPTKKGPPLAPVAAPFSWTGFYVGANVGGLWSRDSENFFEPGYAYDYGYGNTLNLSGVVGGLQAGYNYQIQNFVVGIEGDLDWSSASGAHDLTSGGYLYYHHSASVPFFADLRGRLGYAFDRFLPYVTGGVVVADIHNKLAVWNNDFVEDRGGTSIGWAIGAGVEYAVDAHWSVKADYLYMQFPDVTKYVDDGYYAFKFKDSAQVARVGINYRF